MQFYLCFVLNKTIRWEFGKQKVLNFSHAYLCLLSLKKVEELLEQKNVLNQFKLHPSHINSGGREWNQQSSALGLREVLGTNCTIQDHNPLDCLPYVFT